MEHRLTYQQQQILERDGAERDNVRQINRERQISLDRLFGIDCEVKIERTKGGLSRVTQGEPYPTDSLYHHFSSLRSAYVEYSGDADIRYFGKNVRAIQNFGLDTFEYAFANTLNRLLIGDFFTSYRWKDIVTSITAPSNFHPNTRARIKYVPDLPDLTEDEPYGELQGVTGDDEAVTYTVNQKGAMLTFSRRLLLADDIEGVKRVVEQARRSAWRTLAKRVWNLVISNATYGADGLPIFHANHSNVGTSELSAAALTAARAAIFAQTEPGSTERLGLGGGPLLLAIPIELEATAVPLNHVHFLDSSFTLNPWMHRFGENNERIFANPLLIDANDWYLFDVSGNVGVIEEGFLAGHDQPQVLLDDDPVADANFTQDRVIYKLRHEYEAVILDYRGAYKAVVA